MQHTDRHNLQTQDTSPLSDLKAVAAVLKAHHPGSSRTLVTKVVFFVAQSSVTLPTTTNKTKNHTG